jgi:carbonic anhydrase
MSAIISINKPLTLLPLLLSFLLSSCNKQAIAVDGVKVREQEVAKYSVPSRDPGKYQSPINILTTDIIKGRKARKFTIHFEDKITAVENLGHTVQLDFKSGSRITSDGLIYMFKQMHFHTPAEHLIDGVTYPMELHIVGVNAENSTTPHYLAISILFKMGKESPFINEFLSVIPHKNGKQLVKANSIKLNDLLSSGDLERHYHYKGSLTTPPYIETVNWFVLKKTFEASPAQIKTINTIEGNNARHIEAENNRSVEDN